MFPFGTDGVPGTRWTLYVTWCGFEVEKNHEIDGFGGLDCRCPVIAFKVLERVFQDHLGDGMESQPGEGSGAGEEPVPDPGLPGNATSEPGLSAEGPAA